MTHRDGFPPTRPLARRIARAISMGLYQRSLVSPMSGSRRVSRRPLKELDYVSRRILAQNLFSARVGLDFVAKFNTLCAKF